MPDLERIVAPNPGPMTLDGTNTWLVGRDPAWVIDPGPPDKGHIEAVRSAAERRGGLGGVVLTHSHGDHAGGVELLGVDLTPVREGAPAGPFEVISTPGHAADHVCFLLERTCFTGDLILGLGSSIVPPDGGSLAAYMESLRRLQALDLDLLCPGHGPEVTDPQAKIAEYIEHREMRERKLIAALEAGERSKERLLEIAWDDVPAELLPAAAVALETHLQKLAGEDRLPDGLGD